MKIKELKNKLNQTSEHFKEELSKLRTGKADPSLVEGIKVDAYEGSPPMKMREVATINVVDPKLLTLEPFDKSVTEEITKAILDADVGLNPVVDGTTIKIPVPELSEEQRKSYVKLAKERLEEARISVRNIRQDAIKSVEEREENGKISEDEMNLEKREIESSVKETNNTLEKIFDNKEKELMEM